MRGKAAIFATIGLALLTGCNLMADRRYANEGAGVNLYTTDVDQAVLLEAYTAYVCQQVGPLCSPATMTFVIAGMNDIDQRCDGYLTWLDGKRRDREPVLAQIAAVGAAVHAVMTVTGSSPKSLEILSSAFGLATATYSNWNSRLLISVEQSTVHEVVFKSQGLFREKIKEFQVSDRPTAIYLLRNYLRLCMPTTIEATFNTSTMLVQRSPEAARAAAEDGNAVVANLTPTRPAIIRNINAPLRRFEPGVVTPRPSPTTRLTSYESGMSGKDMRFVLNTLCRPPSEPDLGPVGSAARQTLSKFLTDIGSRTSDRDRLNRNGFIDIQDAGRRAC